MMKGITDAILRPSPIITVLPIPNKGESAVSPVWQMSQTLLKRAEEMYSSSNSLECEVVLLPSDPEYDFVFNYFSLHAPPGRLIKSIGYRHNPQAASVFESGIKKMECEAKDPRFTFNLKEESQAEHRMQTLSRFEDLTKPYSTFQMKIDGSFRTMKRSRILPVWKAIDHQRFGQGYYFTDSASRAAMSNEEKLDLSFIAMRNPYPIVSDIPGGRSSDEIKLGGMPPYRKYNGYFIPENIEDYAPCIEGEQPASDSFVVFQSRQILPRFHVYTERSEEIACETEINYLRACLEGNLTLLKNQFDPSILNLRGPNKETMLYYAALGGHVEIMEWLVKQNDKLLTQTTSFSGTPLYAAFLSKKIEAIKWIYERVPFQLFSATQNEWNLLHLSAFSGYAEGVSWLIETDKKGELLSMVTKEGWSPIYVAAMNGQMAILQLLRDGQGWTQMLQIEARDGSTPLHTAAFRNHLEVVQWLCNENPAWMNQKAKGGNGFLHWAVRGHASDVIRWVASSHPTFTTEANDENERAIHLAAREGKISSLEPLLQVASDKHIALDVAVEAGRFDVVVFLIENGADPFQLANSFSLCAEFGHFQILQELIVRAQGHPELESRLNKQDKYGNTPLHFAAKNGDFQSAMLLISAKAEKHLLNGNKQTPYDLAFEWNHDDICINLLNPLHLTPIVLSEDKKNNYDYYSRILESAYNKGEQGCLVFCLEKLAHLALRQEDYLRASQFLTTAINLVLSHQLGESHYQRLLNKTGDVEKEYLNKLVGISLSRDLQIEPVCYRETLAKIRTDVGTKLKPNQPIENIQAELSQDFAQLLKDIIEMAIQQLGPPPGEFAVVPLGALAKKEMSPYSKVLFTVLTENGHEQNYFENLVNLIELKMTSIGEISMIVEENSISFCPSGFCIDMERLRAEGKSSLKEQVGTVQELTKASINPERSNFLIMGNRQLFDKYQQTIKKQMEKKGKNLGVNLLKKHLDKSFFKTINPSNLNIQRNCDDLFQNIIEGLSLYYNLDAINTRERIKELEEKEKLTYTGSSKLMRAFELSTFFRFKAQLFYRQEFKDNHNLDSPFDSTHEPIIKEMFEILEELQKAVDLFCQGNEEALLTKFYAPRVITRYHRTLADRTLSAVADTLFPWLA